MTWGRGSTRAWRTTRARILQRDPYCQLGLDGCTRISREVDHILNVQAGGTDDDHNLRGVCPPCHRRKTQAEAAAGRAARKRTNTQRPQSPHPGRI